MIKEKINSKQVTKNLQILQDMQKSQQLMQKLTYLQKAAQFANANAQIQTNKI